ncbi:VOC family protein [Fictibacillus phosphorivorans]|uniref:VOC family protein n=1 Tax=Fictibacillus phosphorivorans TaxID=1221500 RepID=UPI001292ECEF|nr:VOC family protein [Fictibacillus phosphorivorans]MQR94911.1 VOC family protein [Fictibacillus phosphorivorans]
MMTPIHKETHIGSVTLKVRNLENLVSFYTETIGLQILSKQETRVELTANGKTPLIVLEGNQDLHKRPMKSAGLYHLALLVPTRKDLANVLYHFIETKTQLLGASNHKFSEAIYLQDPENNGIEIYRDVDRQDWVRDERGKLPAVSEPLDVQSLLAERDSKTWTRLLENTVMGHVHLNVVNIAEAENFYMNVLGFEEQTRIGNHALFISAGGYHHHIAVNIWNGPDAEQSRENVTGLLHYEIVVPSMLEIKKVLSALEHEQVPYHIESENIRLKDPAGNGVVIKARTA